ncbi:hypothetical protein ACFXHA_43480 [Nocardia sp. NPDC059240]|uniref:hypothetical protein n=1 Tax=Nocardia sp. NPDC059240 TaxID=3346786 RepID=UPI0036B158A3
MTKLCWFAGDLAGSLSPWMVGLVVFAVFWRTVVGGIRHCQRHFETRMILREAPGYARVVYQSRRAGVVQSHIVEVGPIPTRSHESVVAGPPIVAVLPPVVEVSVHE